MKPRLISIKLNPNESFTCVDWRLSSREMQWKSQYFADYSITLIIRGRGMRYIGDSVERFRDGDLVLVGPNLPTSWWSDDTSEKNRHISSTFEENFLGEKFMALPEIAPIRALLARAGRGIAFSPAVSKQVAPTLIHMTQTQGGERLCFLISLLNRMAAVRSPRPLASANFSPALNELEAGRLAAACKYIRESYDGKIRRSHAAALAGLSPDAFSRFFHKRMGRTFNAYVTEVRVGHACHKLIEEDSTIAQIAFETGFNNLSNFNHHFRQLKGMSPRDYRHQHIQG